MDLSNPQVVQNILLLIILVFGIISIVLNWRVSTPKPKSSPVNREQDEGWQELFRQSERKRAREEAECEREIVELTTKLAARAAEVEALRLVVDKLTAAQREGVNVHVGNRQGGVEVSGGTVATGQDIVGNDKK